MANSTTNLDVIASGQAQKEITANALSDAMSPSALFGRRASTTTALSWGYYGGNFLDAGMPTQIANGAIALTASATNYLYATSAGVVTKTTSAPAGWPGPLAAGAVALYQILTGASTVTSYIDYRTQTIGNPGIGTVTSVGITAPAAGITASGGPITSAGSFTLALADDLAAVEGLAATGLVRRTATNTWSAGTQVATAEIADSAVTYAKIQNISATDKLLGRSTAGAGAVEEITCTAFARSILDDTDAASVRATIGAGVGGGDCNGPSSAVNDHVATFDGTTGKLIKDSGLTLAGTNTGDETTTTIGALINGATAKTAPVDADFIGLMDSAASNVLKKVSWANVRAGLQGDGLTSAQVGFRNIPQNSQSAAYTTVAADAGKHILHPSADTTARTFTIDSNANVAYPIGAAITFVNQASAGVMTIAITSDTMRLAGAGTTGSRTLAANGIATAMKLTSTEWIISGTGLT